MMEKIIKKRNKPSPARESLLSAGTSLLAVNPGSSLIEIAKYAGVGRASLHRHFSSRDALIHEITERALSELNGIMQDVVEQDIPATDKLLALVEALIPAGDRLHFVMNEWSSYGDTALLEKFRWQENTMLTLIGNAKKEGRISPELSDRWVYYVMDSMIFTTWYGVQDGTVARKEASLLAVKLLTGGVIQNR